MMNIEPTIYFAGIIMVISMMMTIPWISARRTRKRMSAFETALRQVGDRIDEGRTQFTLIDRRIDAVFEQLDRMNMRQTRLDSLAGKVGFEEAKELTRRGADASELISACGLNGGEARLVRTLYGCVEN